MIVSPRFCRLASFFVLLVRTKFNFFLLRLSEVLYVDIALQSGRYFRVVFNLVGLSVSDEQIKARSSSSAPPCSICYESLAALCLNVLAIFGRLR